jgi:hypothetical protein
VVAVVVVVQELARARGALRWASEGGKELLRRVDDGVRLLGLEPLARDGFRPT